MWHKSLIVPVLSRLCINALVLFCIGNVLHQIPRLTIQRGANLIDHAHGHFFDRASTDGGNSRLPDAGLFGKVFLRHVIHRQQNLQAEFDHNNTPFQQNDTTTRQKNQYALRNPYARRAKYFR